MDKKTLFKELQQAAMWINDLPAHYINAEVELDLEGLRFQVTRNFIRTDYPYYKDYFYEIPLEERVDGLRDTIRTEEIELDLQPNLQENDR